MVSGKVECISCRMDVFVVNVVQIEPYLSTTFEYLFLMAIYKNLFIENLKHLDQCF